MARYRRGMPETLADALRRLFSDPANFHPCTCDGDEDRVSIDADLLEHLRTLSDMGIEA